MKSIKATFVIIGFCYQCNQGLAKVRQLHRWHEPLYSTTLLSGNTHLADILADIHRVCILKDGSLGWPVLDPLPDGTQVHGHLDDGVVAEHITSNR